VSLLKERLCLGSVSGVTTREPALVCTTLASTDDFGNLPGSFDLLAETSLVPVDACTSIDPHNNLAADASSASRRSTAATKTRGTDLVGTDRSPPDSGDTTTRQARPVANPSPRRSEQRPAARRLVPYRLDTRRALRKPGGSVVCQRRPNLGCPHRSARSARRQQLHSGHGETRDVSPRLPRSSGAAGDRTRSRAVNTCHLWRVSIEVATTSCVVVLRKERHHASTGRNRAKRAIGHRGDVRLRNRVATVSAAPRAHVSIQAASPHV
jgi:hypothetical protein